MSIEGGTASRWFVTLFHYQHEVVVRNRDRALSRSSASWRFRPAIALGRDDREIQLNGEKHSVEIDQ